MYNKNKCKRTKKDMREENFEKVHNGGNVEFGLGDADLVYHCEINNV
jgi:hypothetical protein